MKNQKINKQAHQQGFSLMEMMIVLFIISIVSAVAVSGLYSGFSQVGGAERIIDEASSRITERRAEAVRLNGDDRRSLLQHFQSAPLPIDFSDLSMTASLKTDGADNDRDCVDDYTGAALTCLNIADGHAEWDLSFNDDALKLPEGWQVYQRGPRFSSLQLIGDGANGRGVQASVIGFDATGKAYAKEYGSDTWVSTPSGSAPSETPSANDAPFWAVYFIVPSAAGGILGRGQQVKAAVAVAIHPSGLIERFHYDSGEWIGFKNRVVR